MRHFLHVMRGIFNVCAAPFFKTVCQCKPWDEPMTREHVYTNGKLVNCKPLGFFD